MGRLKSCERRWQRRSHPKLRSSTQRLVMSVNPLPSLAFLATSTVIGQCACFNALASLLPP